MKIDILTLFPEMFIGPFDTSMLKKARDIQAVKINIHNLRDWATDKHKTVDDRPYGGGKGMILRVDVINRALKESRTKKQKGERVILLCPQGKIFNQKKARELAKLKHIIFIAGHYEGFDERIKEFVDEEISIGEYVLTGGEIPAMVIVDSVVRLLPGVLDPEAVENESFSKAKPLTFDYPQYTRPENFKGLKVPQVLLSGNHKEIAEWREKKMREKENKE